MRVMVTGGAGFMGSNFVEFLVKREPRVEVLVYDKLTYAGRLENLAEILDRVEFFRGDIVDEKSLEAIVSRFKPDIIVNFAAETHVDRSINEPAPFIRTNVYGVFTLLEVLRRHRDALLVHISTDEVYGDLSWTDDMADESWNLRPSSPYSASKASGDLLIMAYGRTYGLDYIIVRPCNNYGPRQHPEKLIPRTIIRLLLGLPATIYGDGGQVRDWLYVLDFAEALHTIIEKGDRNTIYNVCAHNFASVKRVVETIVRLMGRDPERDIIYVKGRPGEDRRYAMKCDRVRELGWSPKTGLEEGLRRTIEWYTSNRWWWEPLVDEYVTRDTPWSL